MLLLATEHEHLIPINFCHHLQLGFSITARDKAVVAGDQTGNTSRCLCEATPRWAHPARASIGKEAAATAVRQFPKLWPWYPVLPFSVYLGTGLDLWGLCP